jgi:hypothetical protein
VLVLRSGELLVRLDPGHGGEILELVDLGTGRQLLGRPPFASDEPRAGDLDEETWTRSYRGGWQCVGPNAGNSCEHEGKRHGFHGRASNDPWTVAEAGPDYASLRWSGHGLEVTRTVSLERGAVVVETEWTALREGASLLAVEHVTLGLELLDPAVEIRLPGGRAFELSEEEGPTRAPEGAPDWPEVGLLDGSRERADVWPLARPRARFLAVEGLSAGWAEARNRGTGQGLRLEWDTRSLPHLWLWHEARATGARGGGRPKCSRSSRRAFHTRSVSLGRQRRGRLQGSSGGSAFTRPCSPFLSAAPQALDGCRQTFYLRA